MGINYYIYINVNINSINDASYATEVCHIGRNSHLDFINIVNFFKCIDSNNVEFNDSVRILSKIRKYIRDDTPIEKFLQVNDFSTRSLYDILVFCYDFISQSSGSLNVADEYGRSHSFSSTILNMCKNPEDKSVTKIPGYSNYYCINGFYINDVTDFF